MASRPRSVRPARCVAGRSYRTHAHRSGRALALTFDDGPSSDTEKILPILRRFRARATFFVVGSQIAGREATLRAELAGGNEIGDHTFTHPHLALDGSDARAEITSAADAIAAVTHRRPCLFRAPYGHISRPIIDTARALGMTTVGWDDASGDWINPSIGADRIYRRVLRRARPGSIVLMHDGLKPRRATVAALPRILAKLRTRGFRFVTVSELLGLADSTQVSR